MDSIATRSTKVEGYLKCGRAPETGAHVRLFRSSSEELDNVMASGVTNSEGRFSIEGDTSRFQGEDSAIDPYIRIYHKCDQESGYRKLELRFPREFVTLGRIPRRTYNIGALNLELGFPKEGKESEIQGLS